MSKQCPNCQKIFEDNHSFCSFCGTRLINKAIKKICPNCQEIYDNSHSFCSHCGARLIDYADENPHKPLIEEEISKLYDKIASTSDPGKLKQLQEAADSGNEWAMNYIGLCYFNGNGVKKNFKEAVKWYQKAADAGNPNSMNDLGNCYYNGNGVKKNFKEAVKWYQKAADAGNPTGMSNLGNCYYNGNGVKKNFKEAVKWYQKAIDGGGAYGMSGLGFCYETGNGVNKSLSEALSWYEKSLENGREKDEWIIERMKACDPNSLQVNIYDVKEDFSSLNNHDRANCLTKVFFSLKVRNIENRFIKIHFNLRPQIISYPSFSRNNIFIFNEDGTEYDFCDEAVFREYFEDIPYYSPFDDNETIHSLYVLDIHRDLEINKSGTYLYDGNISAYDEDNNLLSSCDFCLSIAYKHKMFGADEYKFKTL